ncbi:hypothetical protein ACFYUY_32580 [Kitasatospora sp. NPDC004745]|uniref:hypothetical protein n=1 Tax=Kitasatospora sp. NPDC004745 TaxID=3364019 RepID=UPI00367E7330
MRAAVKLSYVFVAGVSVLAVAACGNEVPQGRAVSAASPSPSMRTASATIDGSPSLELQRRYGVIVPAGANGVSYGYRQEGGGGELWVTFKVGREGLGAFLADAGAREEQLNSGVVEFTASDLELTGWSIDAKSSVKGLMVPAKDGDIKSPSRKVTVDYSDSESMAVFVLAAKP